MSSTDELQDYRSNLVAEVSRLNGLIARIDAQAREAAGGHYEGCVYQPDHIGKCGSDLIAGECVGLFQPGGDENIACEDCGERKGVHPVELHK